MGAELRQALLNRAKQWKTFHEWVEEHGRGDLTIEERVAWYVSAYDFVQRLHGLPTADKQEKTSQIRTLHDRLKCLNSTRP